MSTKQLPEGAKDACPDGGSCWHFCPADDRAPERGRPCWRVLNAGPFSGRFPGDDWPSGTKDAHGVPLSAAGSGSTPDPDEYRELADVIIQAFNPADDDVAESYILTMAVQRAAAFAESRPCTCTPDVTNLDILAEPCDRCSVLGRRGDQLEER